MFFRLNTYNCPIELVQIKQKKISHRQIDIIKHLLFEAPPLLILMFCCCNKNESSCSVFASRGQSNCMPSVSEATKAHGCAPPAKRDAKRPSVFSRSWYFTKKTENPFDFFSDSVKIVFWNAIPQPAEPCSKFISAVFQSKAHENRPSLQLFF